MQIIIILLTLIISTIGKAEQPSGSLTIPEYSPGELIVKISPDASLEEFRELNDQMGAYNAKKVFLNSGIPDHSIDRVYLIRFSQDAKTEQLARKYARNPLIDEAQPNYLRKMCADEVVPNDEKFEEMWHLKKIDMPRAWAIEKGSPKLVIAIVDGGIDNTHPDLTSKIWVNEDEIPSNGIDDDENGYVDDYYGWDFTDAPTLSGEGDFVERDNDPMAKSAHGTHVAGIAGAEVNNRIGVAGVAWNCKIMAIRAGVTLTTGGSRLQDDDSAASIVYAADNGASVINMSWGDREESFIIKDAVDYAYERGCVLVGAAGNGHSSEVIYPAGYTNVIAVASTNQPDERYHGSNYGSVIDIAAPGNVILSTFPDDRYDTLTGTSMATPQVAGAAALMLSKRPSLTNEEVRQIIVSSADAVDCPELVGAGRLNVANALLSCSSLQAKITRPDSRDGGDKSIEIVGSAGGLKFTGWKLQYGESNVPDGWFDIAEDPEAKFNEKIHLWDTSKIEEGIYTIRLKSIGIDELVQDEVSVQIDHSPPKILGLDASRWLIDEYQTTNVIWSTDDLTYSELYYRSVESSHKSFESLSPDAIRNTHLFSLSYNLPSGDYEYFVRSRNLAGLQTIDDNNGDFYKISVFRDVISPAEFTDGKTGLPAMYSTTANADFDGDLRTEIIGVKYDSSFTRLQSGATVKIYEQTEDRYNLVFESSEKYLPLELCDLDRDGRREILGSVFAKRLLFESPTRTGTYPVQKVWQAKDCLASKTADINSNGMGEIITFNHSNEIVIYEALGNDNYQEIARLSNPTDGENTMETDSAVGDFDGDGRMELVAADSDGDFFAYESVRGNQFHHAWTKRTNIRRAHEMDAGDLDGDGKPELIVGGIVLDEKEKSIYWQCLLFESDEDDQIQRIWEQKIQHFYRDTKCDVLIEDFDGDGDNEVLVVVPPNAYIFAPRAETPARMLQSGVPATTSARSKFGGDLEQSISLVPIWHHPAEEGPAVFSSDGFYFNESHQLRLFSHDTSDYRRFSPYALVAVPLDEDTVVLYWKGDKPDASYTVYRGTANSDAEGPLFLERIATDITENEFTDETVTKGRTYWYVISINDQDGHSTYTDETGTSEARIPIETVENGLGLSGLASAIPDFPPKLKSVKYLESDTDETGTSKVSLKFDKPMSKSVRNVNLYSLIDLSRPQKGKLHPASAIQIETGQKVLLTFENGILVPEHDYKLIIGDVRSKNRVSLDSPHEEQFTVPEYSSVQFHGLSEAIVYPNPIKPNQHDVGHITFAKLPAGTKIRIYNVKGTLLEELKVTKANDGKRLWYLTNNAGSFISSGMYLYTLEFDNEFKTGKIAIVK